MTNGVGNVSGGYGNGYSINGYSQGGASQANSEEAKQQQPQVQNFEETQVDPTKVMDFLAANNYFVAPVESSPVGKVDDATRARVEGYMESFEMIYGVIVEEFGEEMAPDVMSIAMDHLMAMAA